MSEEACDYRHGSVEQRIDAESVLREQVPGTPDPPPPPVPAHIDMPYDH